jgi:hypothetical protein
MVARLQKTLFYSLNEGSDPSIYHLYSAVGRASGQDILVGNPFVPLFTG